MALACHTVLTSRIKGYHAYNHDYLVSKELICELEFTKKCSHNSIEVKSKNKDVTVGQVPEALATVYFNLVKHGKFMEFKQKSVVSHDVRQKGLGFFEEE